MYRTLNKINEFYYRSDKSYSNFEKEILKRSEGKNIATHPDFFRNHNPLFGFKEPLAWIVERYRPVFDFVDGKKFGRVLEVGCAHGLSTWFMTDVAEEVWGVDVSTGSIEIAKTLFPEANFSDSDVRDFLSNDAGGKFDLIFDAYGPWGDELQGCVFEHTSQWLHVGYRTRKLKDLLTWGHKLSGTHLSFDATLVTPGSQNRISSGYLRYFFSSWYLRHLKHSIFNGYYPQF